MKALISTIEPREQGYRVAQVEPEAIFNNTEQIYWVDCPEYVVADQYWFNPADNTFAIVPIPEPVPSTILTQEVQTLDTPTEITTTLDEPTETTVIETI